MESIDMEKGDVDTIQIIQVLVEKEKERQNHHQKINSPSIYMVDSTLRSLSPSSFKPRVVAIGPLHKDGPLNKQDTELQGIESHKVTYLHHLFLRLPSMPDQKMEQCVQRVHAKVKQIRACYAGEMKDYSDCAVAKMMVVDACFILEFFLRRIHNDHPDDDPIFDNKLVSLNVCRDLVLLENQIPFFVLQDIFECTILETLNPSYSLQRLVIENLSHIIPFDISYEANISDGVDTSYKHILGLLQNLCQPAEAMTPSEFIESRFYSVEELTKAGVNFRPNQDKKWPLAMEFKESRKPCFVWGWGKPILRMPQLTIEDNTESVLRNLIAYEQCSPFCATYITSYAAAIDMLVDTQDDIVRMVDSEVLINCLGTNQDAANLISSLCKNVILGRFYYNQQWNQLYRYYNGYWPKNIAWLRRTYFSNPWSVIALLGGIILFVLTVIQTYYTTNPVT